jgi:Flp pilus assembly protein TadG
MFTKKSTRHRNLFLSARKGAAAVEFAIVSPLFFLVLAGIIEFGQAFRIEHMLSSACRRGARAAVVEGATTSDVINKVKAQCVQTLNVTGSDITVEVAVSGSTVVNVKDASEGAEISVTVSVPYSKAGIGFYANMFGNSTLSSTCYLEHE